MIRQGQIYLYNDYKEEYEVKIVVDNYVVYKDKSGKILTCPISLFTDMIKSENFKLIKDNNVIDNEKLLVIAMKQLGYISQLFNLLGIKIDVQKIDNETCEKIRQYVDENTDALYDSATYMPLV